MNGIAWQVHRTCNSHMRKKRMKLCSKLRRLANNKLFCSIDPRASGRSRFISNEGWTNDGLFIRRSSSEKWFWIGNFCLSNSIRFFVFRFVTVCLLFVSASTSDETHFVRLSLVSLIFDSTIGSKSHRFRCSINCQWHVSHPFASRIARILFFAFFVSILFYPLHY